MGDDCDDAELDEEGADHFFLVFRFWGNPSVNVISKCSSMLTGVGNTLRMPGSELIEIVNWFVRPLAYPQRLPATPDALPSMPTPCSL